MEQGISSSLIDRKHLEKIAASAVVGSQAFSSLIMHPSVVLEAGSYFAVSKGGIQKWAMRLA